MNRGESDRRRRRKRRAAVVLGGGLTVAAALALPRLFSPAWLRDRVSAELSALAHRPVQCAAARVALLPRPALYLERVNVAIPDALDAAVESIRVRPDLRMLLRGTVRLSQIRVRAPRIAVRSPAQAQTAGGASESAARVASAVLAGAAEISRLPIAGAEVILTDGDLELPLPGLGSLHLRDVDGRASLDPQRLALDLHAAANLWEHAHVQAHLSPQTEQWSGHVDVNGLQPRSLAEPRLPRGLQLGDSTLDLGVTAGGQGPRVARVEVEGAIPALRLRAGGDEVLLRGRRFAASAENSDTETKIALSPLQFDEPALRLAGRLTIADAGARLEVDADDVDVAALRRTALLLAGDNEFVRRIASILKGGLATRIELRSEAPRLAALGSAAALRIAGRLQGGRVHVPNVDLDLEEAEGDVAIADAVLSADAVSARMGKSRASAGGVRVGLGGGAAPLNVAANVEADAAELAALLARLVSNDSFRKQMKRFSDFDGTATGSLRIDGTTRDVRVRAEASAFRIAARAEGFGKPLSIDGGRFAYDPQRIEASDITLAAGGSRLSELALRLEPGRPGAFEVAARASTIAIDEVYPWLRDAEWLPRSSLLPSKVNGTLEIESARLAGVPDAKGAVEVELAGSARNLTMERIRLPRRIGWKTPVSLSNLRVHHDPRGGTSVAANLAAPGNLTGFVDVGWMSGRLDLRELRFRDAESDVAMSLRGTEQDASLSFRGHLAKGTADALFENDLQVGSVAGDLRARIRPKQPALSTVNGRFEARGVELPAGPDRRFRIVAMDIEGAGRRASGSADLEMIPGTPLRLQGHADATTRGFDIDVGVAAGDLDWAMLASWFAGGSAPRSADTPPSWVSGVRGKVRVDAESLTYAGLTWKPLRAVVSLGAGDVKLQVDDAALCGIQTPGRITLRPRQVTLAFEPHARGRELHDVLPCLGVRADMEAATYNLAAKLTASGAGGDDPSGFARSLGGQLHFEAERGRLQGMGVLARVLAFVRAATGAVWTIPDVAEEGLPYDRLRVVGDVRDGTLVLKEASLSGPSVQCAAEGSVHLLERTLDLTVLVAPLRTVDAVVGRIPVIGTVLGGNLVTIPVSVSGKASDPTIVPLPPTAVGKSLMNVMTRTLTLPMRAIQPILPGDSKP